MLFYQDLKDLAETPSESDFEFQIRKVLLKKLNGLVDSIKVDDLGNIYAVRNGAKDGMLMFSAHQDKVMDSTISGRIVPFMKGVNSNLIFDSKQDYMDTLDSLLFALTNQGFEPLKLVNHNKDKSEKEEFIEVPYPSYSYSGVENQLERKLYIPLNLSVDTSPIQFKDSISLYALTRLKENKQYVRGKLDDTVGLSLILDMLRNTSREQTPSILALLTVGEEGGSRGAKHSITNVTKKYNPDKIIVLDTTPLQKPDTGIVLYEDCARSHQKKKTVVYTKVSFTKRKYTKEPFVSEQIPTKEPLVSELEEFAREYDFPLTTHPSFINDSNVFASETEIPTVALEVPIENMHSSLEICSKTDIAIMRIFLNRYITR